jgi:hypothetical protein
MSVAVMTNNLSWWGQAVLGMHTLKIPGLGNVVSVFTASIKALPPVDSSCV